MRPTPFATTVARAALLLAIAAPASAQSFNSKSVFLAAAGTPFYTETFETVPIAKDAASTGFTQSGITYTPLAGVRTINLWVSSPGYTNYGAGLNPTTSSILTANGDEWFRLTFASSVYGFGLDAYYNGLGPATTSFFNGSTLLGSVSYNGAAVIGFAGFLSTLSAPITSVEFQSTLGGQLNTGIDNVMIFDAAVTTAPEPASVALTATGLLGLIAVGRRRRR